MNCWTPARVEGESGQQFMTPDNWESRDNQDNRIVPRGFFLSNPHTVSASWHVHNLPELLYTTKTKIW